MKIGSYLIGNDWDTGPCVQQRKMWIFSEMSNMTFHLEYGGIRGDLLVSDNFLNRPIKPTLLLLLLLLISFQSKMRGKISTPSAKAGTTTPFAFGPLYLSQKSWQKRWGAKYNTPFFWDFWHQKNMFGGVFKMTADLRLSIVHFFPFVWAFIHYIFIISEMKSNDCQITIDIDDDDENDGFDFDSDNEDDGKSQLASQI